MPHSNIRPQTRERARRLRRELTKAEARDAFLKDQGFTVLRFDNAQVLGGPDHVFVEIQKHAAPYLKEPA